MDLRLGLENCRYGLLEGVLSDQVVHNGFGDQLPIHYYKVHAHLGHFRERQTDRTIEKRYPLGLDKVDNSAGRAKA